MAEGSESIGKSSPMKCQGTPPEPKGRREILHIIPHLISTRASHAENAYLFAAVSRAPATKRTRAAHAEISCMSSLWRDGRLRRNAASIDITAARSQHTGTNRTRLWLAHKLMCGRTYRDAAKPRQLRVARSAHKEYSACEVRVLKTRAKSAC